MPASAEPMMLADRFASGSGYAKSRLPERLVGGGGREQGVAVGEQDELVALEVAQPGLVVEVRDLRGDADAEIEIRDVGGHLQEVGIVLKEALDRRNRRPALSHARPELGDRLADRRYDAHSGDDDASTCSYVSHPETASCATLASRRSGSRIACNGKGIGNRVDNCRAACAGAAATTAGDFPARTSGPYPTRPARGHIGRRATWWLK